MNIARTSRDHLQCNLNPIHTKLTDSAPVLTVEQAIGQPDLRKHCKASSKSNTADNPQCASCLMRHDFTLVNTKLVVSQ